MPETITADIELVLSQFPFKTRKIHGKPLAFLDSAASSQMPERVIERMNRYHRSEHANVHRGIHLLSQEATVAYEAVRPKLQKFINAASQDEIILTSGATDAINLVAYSYGLSTLKAGDEILISEMEHHANMVPWQLISKLTGAVIKKIPITDSGEIDIDAYKLLLKSPKVKIIAIVHVSNVLGTENPVAQMTSMAHGEGAVVVVDGCQATPHAKVDVQALGADFYAFSAHKMYGPTGIGVLWGRKELLTEMPPFRGGGDMIDKVSFEGTTFNDLPHKFEAGTPPIVAGIGFSEALDFMNELGIDFIAEREHQLYTYALEQLSKIDSLIIYGNAQNRHPVISFNVSEIHPHDLGTILDQEGVAVRTGHHCAQPLMRRLDVPATARASFAVYNTFEEIDQLVAAIHQAKEIFS